MFLVPMCAYKIVFLEEDIMPHCVQYGRIAHTYIHGTKQKLEWIVLSHYTPILPDKYCQVPLCKTVSNRSEA